MKKTSKIDEKYLEEKIFSKVDPVFKKRTKSYRNSKVRKQGTMIDRKYLENNIFSKID